MLNIKSVEVGSRDHFHCPVYLAQIIIMNQLLDPLFLDLVKEARKVLSLEIPDEAFLGATNN
jgi:hypothetical protein